MTWRGEHYESGSGGANPAASGQAGGGPVVDDADDLIDGERDDAGI